MIRLPDVALPNAASGGLASLQANVDGRPTYGDRVAAAKDLFAIHNTRHNATFKLVRVTLDSMCCGARRCGYCEDSAADEVEHIRPKDFYPEAAFDWGNYLYACGTCNGPKGSRCAIIVAGPPTALVTVARKKGEPIEPPPAGIQAMIDPRTEDPMDFLMLDLEITFMFVKTAEPETIEYVRADYTDRVLHLSDRDYLVRARRQAYGNFRAMLHTYVAKKQKGEAQAALDEVREGIRSNSHQTVWREMQRQHKLHPELESLFGSAPEALSW